MSGAFRPLGQPLPKGERVLWQGRPSPAPFLRQIFHLPLIVAYVGLLLGWCLMTGMQTNHLGGAVIASLRFAGLSGVAIALFAALAWGLARSTTYSITTARVIFEYGLAMPKGLSIPFTSVDSASVRQAEGGAGDLVLGLRPGQRVNYLLLWPHVRPGSLFQGEPMLRALPDTRTAAQILSRALAASAGVNPVPIATAADAPARDQTMGLAA